MNINERNVQVTIGMPVFNDVQFIEESLLSILNQTFKDFVLIISDDGSTDGSADICKKYALLDKRVKYIRQDRNLGISKNMEFLLSQAKTPYFMWAADDDLWDPTFIENLACLLDSDSEAIVAFSRYAQIDEISKDIFVEIDMNYSFQNRVDALSHFVKYSDDGFGYGLFRTEKIRAVRFPEWWWPCHKTALNNIFPSLCFYLMNGKYLHSTDLLFFKRVKSIANTNHTLTSNSAKLELIKYAIRKFYLCVYTSSLVYKFLPVKHIPSFIFMLFKYWFIKPIIGEVKMGLR